MLKRHDEGMYFTSWRDDETEGREGRGRGKRKRGEEIEGERKREMNR